MSPARFGVQILIVLTMLVAVSWPELGQVRAISVWRTNGPVSADRSVAFGVARVVMGDQERAAGQFGFGSAAYAPSFVRDAGDLRRRLTEDTVEGRRRRTIPAAVLALGGRFNAILGRARTALNAPFPGARLLLRNLTTGLVEARATASDAGEFVFLDVLPSGYVVELVDDGGEVIATSESLTIDIGDLLQTTVRGTSAGVLQAMFGSLMDATADAVISAASRDGVTRVMTPERCVSPPCSR
jgi:hypothetical protein